MANAAYKRRKRARSPRTGAIIGLAAACALCAAGILLLNSLEPPAPVDAVPALTVESQSPSPSPTPMPTPTLPPVSIRYTDSEEHPLPSPDQIVERGASYKLRGTVEANDPLTAVTLTIDCAYNEDLFYPYKQSVTFDPAQNRLSYTLDDADTLEADSLDALVRFSDLGAGIHTLTLLASTKRQPRPTKLFSVRFYVLSDEWERFKSTDFNNNGYASALKFFGGDKERFLYRYQRVHARYTVADPAWENAYIIDFTDFGGEPWRIHKDALPFYQEAVRYLKAAHVRVSGTNGDSGVLPLASLVDTYNGSYVSRFTSSERVISHHALGTATDLNAGMDANDNKKENNDFLLDEVGSKLTYNGIKNEDGVSYYDYTYSGDYLTWVIRDVPESVINYLLYELAFYRAGFQWGYYYVSTSDAMHFTLTESIKGTHDGAGGLRKVYEYID